MKLTRITQSRPIIVALITVALVLGVGALAQQNSNPGQASQVQNSQKIEQLKKQIANLEKDIRKAKPKKREKLQEQLEQKKAELAALEGQSGSGDGSQTTTRQVKIPGLVKNEDGNPVQGAKVSCLVREASKWAKMDDETTNAEGAYTCEFETTATTVYVTAQKDNAWCDIEVNLLEKITKYDDIVIDEDTEGDSTIEVAASNLSAGQSIVISRQYPYNKPYSQEIKATSEKKTYSFTSIRAGYYHVTIQEGSKVIDTKTALVDGESTDKVVFTSGCKPTVKRAEDGMYRMLMIHQEVDAIGDMNGILSRAQSNGYTHVLIYNHRPLLEALNDNSPKTAFYQGIAKSIRDKGMCVIIRGPSVWHPGQYYRKDVTLGSAKISDGPRFFADIRKVSELKAIWTVQATNLKKMFGSDIGVLISNDEFFLLPEPPAGKTVGDMISDISQADLEAIRSAIPGAEIYTWSDIYSPWENATADTSYRAQHDYLHANHPAKKYGARGSLTNSWKWLENNKDVIVLNWAGTFNEKPKSFKHFNDLGVRQVAVGYYNNNSNYCIDHILAYAKQSGVTPYGVMYATWNDSLNIYASNGPMLAFSRLQATTSNCE